MACMASARCMYTLYNCQESTLV